MKIDKQLLLLLFLNIGYLSLNAQEKVLPEVSEDRLRRHISFLASDSLKGRGVNTPEVNLAAMYIKNNIQQMNASSPADDFFQHFTITSLVFDKNDSYLKVLNRKGKKKKHIKNFIAFNQQSNIVDIEGEMIFAGFGITGSLPADADREETDYSGKIVLYSAGTPETFRTGTSHRLNNSLEQQKMMKMQDAGAKALVLVTSIHDADNSIYNQIRSTSERQKFTLAARPTSKLPDVFIITPQTADELTGKNLNWGKTLTAVSENGIQNLSTAKSFPVRIRSVITEEMVESKNVIGLIEGSDSLLKDECVVFIAHYDHLGTNSKGEIFNGADDNASGVATLIEVAGMFSRQAVKPRRSMLFLFPAAEEIGLFGSDHYTQNPVFPLEKTAACINLDMVGRVFEERDTVWDHSPKQVKDFDGIYTLVNDFSPSLKKMTTEACLTLELEPDFSLPAQFFYTSDHYHFHKNQVPVLNISTGYSADYHKPTDTADRIRTDKMKRVAHLCYLLGTELGNKE